MKPKKCVVTWPIIDHQKGNVAGKWESSGATKHTESWDCLIEWILANLKNLQERKISECSKINNLEVKTKFHKSFEVFKSWSGESLSLKADEISRNLLVKRLVHSRNICCSLLAIYLSTARDIVARDIMDFSLQKLFS